MQTSEAHVQRAAPLSPVSLDTFVPAATAQRMRDVAAGSDVLLLAILSAGAAVCAARYGASRRAVVLVPFDSTPGKWHDISVDVPPTDRFRDVLVRTRAALLERRTAPSTTSPSAITPGASPAVASQEVTFAAAVGDSLGGGVPAGASLALYLQVRGAGIELRTWFDPAALSMGLAGACVRHLLAVIEAGLGEIQGPVSRLPSLAPSDREPLADRDNDRTLHGRPLVIEAFRRTARAHAARPALVDAAGEMSYDALKRVSNRLAHVLRSRGVGLGDAVAICLPRNSNLIVALLATVKAGAAYVPLDPALPPERLSSMIEQAGARLLMASSTLCRTLSEVRPMPPSLSPEHWAGALEAAPDREPDVAIPEGALAYVIYTSGTTGTPQPVGIAHDVVARRMETIAEAYGLSANDRVMQFASPSFDAFGEEVFPILLRGGVLLIPFEELASVAPADYLQTADRLGATVLHLVPVYLRELLSSIESGAAAPPAQLRLTTTGGEPIKTELARRWTAAARSTLLNAYGPTEAAITVATYPLEPALSEGPGAWLPAGRPVRDAALLVVNRDLELVPPGIRGEIVIGGPCLARGYLGNARLTAERFVPDAEGAPGARAYRTGDSGRWTPAGALEVLGRIDHQVKIRGQRVELGEIEAILAAHPDVEHVAVVPWKDPRGDTRLTAFIASRDGEVAAERLRSWALDNVPAAMMPTRIVAMASLPAGPTGKIDRGLLQEQGDAPASAPPRTDAVPLTPLERTLTAIWTEVLGVSGIGPDDNFFGVGGDSILNIQIVAKAARRGLPLKAQDVFRHQTIRDLAGALAQRNGADAVPAPADGRWPLTRMQRWFLDQRPLNPHHFNQGVVLEMLRRVRAATLVNVFAHLQRRHDALRLRLTSTDPSTAQQEIRGAADTGVMGLVDLSQVPSMKRGRVEGQIAAALQRSLHLVNGPVMRAALLRGGDTADRLVIAIHHAAIDGVSWRILLDDFDLCCRGELEEAAPGTTYRQWLAAVAKASPATSGETAGAAAERPEAPPVRAHPQPDFDGVNDVASEQRVVMAVTRGAAVPGTEARLVAAAAMAMMEDSGTDVLWLEVEGHGRQPLGSGPQPDVHDLVGWIGTIDRVRIDRQPTVPATMVNHCAERLMKARARGGAVLPSPASPADPQQPRPSVLFNYLGQLDASTSGSSWFRVLPNGAGPVRGGDEKRFHELDIVAYALHGDLHVEWRYGANRYQAGRIRAMAERCAETFQHLNDMAAPTIAATS